MKDFVAYIVKNLVDNPDKVRINEVGGTHTLIIELAVEKSDIGKIIGKKGKTINAIRTLLMSVASRNGIRVNLEIIEEDEEKEEVAVREEVVKEEEAVKEEAGE
ncbi:KH domain-containing protein [Simkania negevensis]|uniref:RNA-binding protein KhpA n=1 Tax=Simkania negevensis TaxID=83561 RepID=A0ABS3AQL4_9BACT|nr:KH domain-containing protein [Simkania negevensis]